MALFEHKPGDVSVKIMRKGKDKFKRGVREAINIKKTQTNLKQKPPGSFLPTTNI